ncbi:DUF2884 family protein [Edwardsiella tarda]|uniref:DUF2884 family protein n=1 Tax=Edwardsiella tarda TaxID=636 RepID=UPI00351BED0C
MGKWGCSLLLLLAATQAQAAWQCQVKPQDDIIIGAQQVQIVGASGNLQIARDGAVTRDGHPLALSADARRQAETLQRDIRRDVPWIDQGIQTRLDRARGALDNIIVEQLGSDSHVRQRLATLDTQLKAQMNRVLEKRSDGYAFHHQAIAQVEKEGQTLVNQTLGGVLQDSINEMGAKGLLQAGKSDNPLQAVLGNLGGLQQAIRSEWDKQDNDLRAFGQQACERVQSLDNQRKALLKALPAS